MRRPVPFCRRLLVVRDGRTLISADYWARAKELSEWPAFGDLPDYIVETTSTLDARRSRMKSWMLTRAGVDLSTIEGQERLQRAMAFRP